jgi:hypothetical protein
MTFEELIVVIKRILSNMVDISTIKWNYRKTEFLQEVWIKVPMLSDEHLTFFCTGLKILGVRIRKSTIPGSYIEYLSIDIVERFDIVDQYVGVAYVFYDSDEE